MAVVINMPRLSDTMEEGTVATWLKQVGDTIEEGDILAEIETDKATMELEAYEANYCEHTDKENIPNAVYGLPELQGLLDLRGKVIAFAEPDTNLGSALDNAPGNASTRQDARVSVSRLALRHGR